MKKNLLGKIGIILSFMLIIGLIIGNSGMTKTVNAETPVNNEISTITFHKVDEKSNEELKDFEIEVKFNGRYGKITDNPLTFFQGSDFYVTDFPDVYTVSITDTSREVKISKKYIDETKTNYIEYIQLDDDNVFWLECHIQASIGLISDYSIKYKEIKAPDGYLIDEKEYTIKPSANIYIKNKKENETTTSEEETTTSEEETTTTKKITTTVKFEGTKKVEYKDEEKLRDINDFKFKFDVKEANSNKSIIQGKPSDIIKSEDNVDYYTIEFPEITYTEDDIGLHTYYITETKYDLTGVNYDTHSEKVEVKVFKDGNELKADIKYDEDGINFENTISEYMHFALSKTNSYYQGNLGGAELTIVNASNNLITYNNKIYNPGDEIIRIQTSTDGPENIILPRVDNNNITTKYYIFETVIPDGFRASSSTKPDDKEYFEKWAEYPLVQTIYGTNNNEKINIFNIINAIYIQKQFLYPFHFNEFPSVSFKVELFDEDGNPVNGTFWVYDVMNDSYLTSLFPNSETTKLVNSYKSSKIFPNEGDAHSVTFKDGVGIVTSQLGKDPFNDGSEIAILGVPDNCTYTITELKYDSKQIKDVESSHYKDYFLNVLKTNANALLKVNKEINNYDKTKFSVQLIDDNNAEIAVSSFDEDGVAVFNNIEIKDINYKKVNYTDMTDEEKEKATYIYGISSSIYCFTDKIPDDAFYLTYSKEPDEINREISILDGAIEDLQNQFGLVFYKDASEQEKEEIKEWYYCPTENQYELITLLPKNLVNQSSSWIKPQNIFALFYDDEREYYLNELLPDGIDNNNFYKGVTYDIHKEKVKVKITGEYAEEPIVTIEYADGEPVFKNSYTANGSVVLTGDKILEGKELKDNQFEFDLKENNKIIETVKNKNGKVTFSKINYNLDDVGTHTYTISEKQGNEEGVEYDTHAETVTVKVTDNKDGTLKADIVTDEDGVKFTNVYSAKGNISISGHKTFTNKNMEEFSYILKEGDKEIATVSNDKEGDFTFPDIEYSLDDLGEHVYTVSEIKDDKDGVIYDEHIEKVIVKVSDNGNGTLNCEIETDEDGIEFTNIYNAEGSITLEGIKKLEGRDIESGEFDFILKNENNEIERTTVDSEGLFSFAPIQFTISDAGKTFEYIITEVKGTDENIVYDEHEEKVIIEVSDNGDGTLTVSPTYDEDGVLFVNSYEEPTIITEEETEPTESSTVETTESETNNTESVEKVTTENITTIHKDANEIITKTNPDTGDKNLLPLWISIIVTSTVIITSVSIRKRSKKDN